MKTLHPFVSKFSTAKRHFIDKPKNRRLLLFLTLLLPILILLILTTAPKHYQSYRRLQQRGNHLSQQHCKYGTVYVYDVPSIFNKKIVESCQELDPWNSRCNAFINDGFGPQATGLDGIVPPELTTAWYWTDIFAGEVMYHSRILRYKCRTKDPKSATAFYIPFYAGLAIAKYLYGNHTAVERDSQCQSLLRWVMKQPTWRRSNGADHFIMLGRTSWDFRREAGENWGSSFLLMPQMRRVSRLAIEGNLWDRMDFGVPYPTGFHPKSQTEVEKWLKFVRTRNRSNLFTFVGGKRELIKNDFRALLLDYCQRESDSCKLVDCTNSKTPCNEGTPAILEAFLDSNFCLQPRGDSYTRKSTFDCMLAGSIPVFFWKKSIYGHYDWFFKDDPERFSVFIDEKAVRNGTSIRKILEGYGVEEIQMMRERVTNLIPRLLYTLPVDGEENIRDAFDIAVEGVMLRIRDRSINQE
ncbi:OLC1v1011550C1 [Oldenlandia corymbosa var. corymbosa]|uniref:OLC1v1011550C1 n=1 Tax=Oldenlandia corymbosa var. corymbosa TaxID=529605 RepID=A0AAV1DTW8_OLDCO|nr:OLC1v1011550C1 [Oldenlandia corymbosa var. corymbosa]